MPGTRARRWGIGIAVAAASALGVSALAGPVAVTTIEANDNDEFVPKTPTRPLGAKFNWDNTTLTRDHTATRTGVISWNFDLPGGSGPSPTKTLAFAGAYGVFCSIHGGPGFGMFGTLKIPLRAFDPAGGPNDNTGTTATNFRITVGTRDANAGQGFEIQKRNGQNGQWTLFRRTDSRITTFDPSSPGTYFFRSRVRKDTTTNGATGYSPQRKVIVQ